MSRLGVNFSVSIDVAKVLAGIENIKNRDGGIKRIMHESMQRVCKEAKAIARDESVHKYKDRTGNLTRAISYNTRRKGDEVSGKIYIDLKKAPYGKFVIQGFKGSSHSAYVISPKQKRIMAFFTTDFPKRPVIRKPLQWKNRPPRPPSLIEQKFGETKWVKTIRVDHPGYKGDDILGRVSDILELDEYLKEVIVEEINAKLSRY